MIFLVGRALPLIEMEIDLFRLMESPSVNLISIASIIYWIKMMGSVISYSSVPFISMKCVFPIGNFLFIPLLLMIADSKSLKKSSVYLERYFSLLRICRVNSISSSCSLSKTRLVIEVSDSPDKS